MTADRNGGPLSEKREIPTVLFSQRQSITTAHCIQPRALPPANPFKTPNNPPNFPRVSPASVGGLMVRSPKRTVERGGSTAVQKSPSGKGTLRLSTSLLPLCRFCAPPPVGDSRGSTCHSREHTRRNTQKDRPRSILRIPQCGNTHCRFISIHFSIKFVL